MAGIAAALPDLDSLTILLGPGAYARYHRLWGHNVFAAAALGGLAGGLEYGFNFLGRLHRAAATKFPRLIPALCPASVQSSSFSLYLLAVWIVVGMLAALSHLPVDVVYSGHPTLLSWPLQLLWPFSTEGWVFPVVLWGDLGTPLLFIGAMFALYRWPACAQGIACLTLAAVLAYIGIWWLVSR